MAFRQRRPDKPTLATLGVVLGGYVFTRYGKKPGKDIRLAAPAGADAAYIRRTAEAVFLARDLVNTPTNDMGPDELEQAGARWRAGTRRKSRSSRATTCWRRIFR